MLIAVNERKNAQSSKGYIKEWTGQTLLPLLRIDDDRTMVGQDSGLSENTHNNAWVSWVGFMIETVRSLSRLRAICAFQR